MELYGRDLASPDAMVVGIVGRAKSSLIKTYAFGQSLFRRQVWSSTSTASATVSAGRPG